MGSRVPKSVPVGRPPAQESAIPFGLVGHRGANAELDPSALALGHPSEQHHDEVVRFRTRINGTADLGHPETNVVVEEDGVRQPELVSVEGSLGLADDDRLETSLMIRQELEKSLCLGPPLPGHRPGLTLIEERRHNRTMWIDELSRPAHLPTETVLRCLMVLGGDPAIERKAHGLSMAGDSRSRDIAVGVRRPRAVGRLLGQGPPQPRKSMSARTSREPQAVAMLSP